MNIYYNTHASETYASRILNLKKYLKRAIYKLHTYFSIFIRFTFIIIINMCFNQVLSYTGNLDDKLIFIFKLFFLYDFLNVLVVFYITQSGLVKFSFLDSC